MICKFKTPRYSLAVEGVLNTAELGEVTMCELQVQL